MPYFNTYCAPRLGVKSRQGHFTWEHGLLLSLLNMGLKWIRFEWPQIQIWESDDGKLISDKHNLPTNIRESNL